MRRALRMLITLSTRVVLLSCKVLGEIDNENERQQEGLRGLRLDLEAGLYRGGDSACRAQLDSISVFTAKLIRQGLDELRTDFAPPAYP